MKYLLTPLEEDIKKLYKILHIEYPYEMDMWNIAGDLDIWIQFHEHESEMVKRRGGLYTLFLNEDLSIQEEWQDFGHELAHVIKHVGKQDEMQFLFRQLQENQANSFMYHFCVPTFMLLNMNISNYHNIIDGIDIVAENFNVTKEFAKRRLEMFRDQMLQAQLDEKFIEDLKNKPVINYSKCVKPRKFPEHTKDIVALAIARKKEKEGILF